MRFFPKLDPFLLAVPDIVDWNRGDFPSLGMVTLTKDSSRKIVGYTLSPAAKFLQQTYKLIRK
jgi:hypothetical protein